MSCPFGQPYTVPPTLPPYTVPPTLPRGLQHHLRQALHQHGHLAENFYLDTIDPLITDRVLAHVAAHTGVDTPSLTTPSIGSHAPPAVTHARLLATRLLRCTALASFTAIGAAIGGDGNHLADNDRRYRRTLAHNTRLVAELNQLVRAVERWRVPLPAPPSTPHHQRMRAITRGNSNDKPATPTRASNAA